MKRLVTISFWIILKAKVGKAEEEEKIQQFRDLALVATAAVFDETAWNRKQLRSFCFEANSIV